MEVYVGVDIGGSHIGIGLLSAETCELVSTAEIPFDRSLSPERAIDFISESIFQQAKIVSSTYPGSTITSSSSSSSLLTSAPSSSSSSLSPSGASNSLRNTSSPTQTRVKLMGGTAAALGSPSKGGHLSFYILGAGIGCPGQAKNGVLVAASNLPNFKNAPLAQMLKEKLVKELRHMSTDGLDVDNARTRTHNETDDQTHEGGERGSGFDDGTVTSFPVILMNDADAAISAEVWGKKSCAAYEGAENIAMITLGTGIGLGLVLRNSLFQGSNGLVEGGHMIVCGTVGLPDDSPLPSSNGQAIKCGCGQRGCVEAYASAKNTAARYEEEMKRYFRVHKRKEGAPSGGGHGGAKEVFEHASKGDRRAQKIINEVCVHILF